MTFTYKTLCTFVFLLTVLEKAKYQTDSLSKRIEEIEQNIIYLASEADRLYLHRESEVKKCQCSVHACANDLQSTDMKICGYVERFYCDENRNDGIYEYCIGEYRDPGGTIIKLPPYVAPNELSAAAKESICTYRKIEDKFSETLDIYVDKSVMIGTFSGAFRKWPRHAYPRDFEIGQQDYNYCDNYDPRSRPWFIGAISGPKDVIIMIDRTVNMLNIWSNMKDITKGILDTLYIYDYVNIVMFSKDVEILMNDYSFVSVTKENINDLKTRIDNFNIDNGVADFEKAFEVVFDLFDESKVECSSSFDSYAICESSKCTRTIILISSSEPKQINDILDYVEIRQNSTLTNGKNVSIHTISIDETIENNSFLRQLSCSNIGSWTHIKEGDDIKYQLATLLSFNSISQTNDNPVWIADYTDWTGLGSVTSVAKVIKSDAGYVVGVLSQTVPVGELAIETGLSEYDVLSDLVQRSSICLNQQIVDQCQLQVFRVIEDSVCVASTPKSKCYQYKSYDLYYQIFNDATKRDDAQSECQEKGGNLVSIRDEEHLSFIASIASIEGSWLGAYYKTDSANDEFKWIDETVNSIDDNYIGWAAGEADKNVSDFKKCVLIDRRGATRNMYISDCNVEKEFICEFKNIPMNCSTEEIYVYEKDNEFETPPLEKCDGEAEESLAHKIESLKPVDAAANLTFDDIVCDFGDEKTFNELTCCDYNAAECNGPGTNGGCDCIYRRLFLIFVSVFILLFICLCVSFATFVKFYKSKDKDPGPDNKEETYD